MKTKTYNKLLKIAEIDMRKYKSNLSLRLQKQYIEYHVLGLQAWFRIRLCDNFIKNLTQKNKN